MKMRNIAIALAAIIAFTMTTCDNGDGGDPGKDDPSITGVTVTPAGNATSVAKGATLQFTANVAAKGGASQAVTWSVNSALSTISTSGLLTVSAHETAGSLIVTATSTYDPSKTNSTTVTVGSDPDNGSGGGDPDNGSGGGGGGIGGGDPGNGSGGGSGDGDGGNKPPPPEGIKGFPATLSMGVPFDLRKNITINLPEAPHKTFDDIIWSDSVRGTRFPTDQIVIDEDDLFIPVTFLDSVTVYAIVKDGEGEGFDYTEIFQTKTVFPLNPFIGSWDGSDGKTWTFNKDGTYGIDTDSNAGSFVVWSGRPGRKFLVTVSGDPAAITVQQVGNPDNGLYTAYCFVQTGTTIKITQVEFDYNADDKQDPCYFDEVGTPITLTRQSGAAAALDLSLNASSEVMIGNWYGGFAATAFNPATGTISGSGEGSNNNPITYFADGRVANTHYQGAWLKRGAVFVTVGNDGRRWDPPALASWDTVTAAAMGGRPVVRIHEYRPNGPGTPYSRATNTQLFWRLARP
jgi:hypothetical protein